MGKTKGPRRLTQYRLSKATKHFINTENSYPEKHADRGVDIEVSFRYSGMSSWDEVLLAEAFEKVGLTLHLNGSEGCVTASSDTHNTADSIEVLCRRLIPGFLLTCTEVRWR